MTSVSPLSPPNCDEGQGKGLLPRPMADQLKAKLYATSEIHSNTQPVLKVRRRQTQEEVSALLNWTVSFIGNSVGISTIQSTKIGTVGKLWGVRFARR